MKQLLTFLCALLFALAGKACARPISNPSGVVYELSDMFCALNGAGR